MHRTLRILLACSASVLGSDLHQEAFVFDGHVHMINRQYYLGGDLSDRYPDGQVDLHRLREGGVDALFFSIYSQEAYYPRRFELRSTLRLMDLALRQIGRNPAMIEVARNATDIQRLHKAGKIAAFLDLEGGFDLDGDLAVLRTLHQIGLRSAMLAAHNFTNGFADSCCAPSRWRGINERGREVVREMNRLGMVINVAHGSDETIVQTAEASSHPVLFSHGGSRRFVDTPRNLSDEAARKIASKGGVIGIHLGNTFHNRAYYDYRQKGRPFGDVSASLRRWELFDTIEALDREAAKGYPVKPAPVPEHLRMETSRFVDVLDHWIRLVGDDHVAIGSDFDGGPEPARGWSDIRDLPKLTEEMQRRGYSEQRIRKILGLNLLRLVRQVTGN